MAAATKRKSQGDLADGVRPTKRSAAPKSRSRDSRALKRNTEADEIKELERAAVEFVEPKEYGRFDHLPLSMKTRQGEQAHSIGVQSYHVLIVFILHLTISQV